MASVRVNSSGGSVTDYKYGEEHPDQFCRVHLPRGVESASAPLPVAVVIHGGFWKNKWTVDNAAHMTLAPDLACPIDSARTAYVAIEMEYRRRDHLGGGFPGSMEDAACCLAHLPVLAKEHSLPLDLGRVVLIGHSAGGQIALWLAEHSAAEAARGAESMPVPRLVVGVAPITDMIAAFERKLSDEGDAAECFMQCRPSDSEASAAKYHEASPRHRLPARVPAVLVAGLKDTDVPEDLIREYCLAVANCEGSAPVRMLTFGGADHYTLMDASSDEWRTTRGEIDAGVQQLPP